MEMIVPAVLLLYAVAMTARMLARGPAGNICLGVLMRDSVRLLARALGAIIFLPFRVLGMLLRNGPPSSSRDRRRPKQRGW